MFKFERASSIVSTKQLFCHMKHVHRTGDTLAKLLVKPPVASVTYNLAWTYLHVYRQDRHRVNKSTSIPQAWRGHKKRTWPLYSYQNIMRRKQTCTGRNAFQCLWYIAFTSQGNIVVSDKEKHTISVVSPVDNVIKFTYGDKARDQQFNGPCGVCVDAYDNIIVADMSHILLLLNSGGKFVKYLATEKDGVIKAVAVAISSNGDLAVTQFETKQMNINILYHIFIQC